MTFLNPILVSVGIASIAIPIVIHILMRRRRRPVAWGAMKFLMEAYRQQRRRTRLEQLLLLACRCLLVALVALALGKPVLGALGGVGSGGPRTIYFVIDDSLSSRARADGTTGLDRARARATEILGTLSQARGDRVAIIGAGSPARAIVLPPSGDLSVVAEALRQIESTDARADFADAITLVRDDQARDAGRSAGVTKASGGSIIVLSEFRGGIDPSRALPTLAAPEALTLRASQPPQTQLPNTAIQRVEPTRSLLIGSATGSEIEARVSLIRSIAPGSTLPEESVRVRLRALAGEAEIGAGEGVVRFNAGQNAASAVVRASVRIAPARGTRVVLEARLDPASGGSIARDDAFVVPLESRERLEIALIAPGPLTTGGTAADFSPADWAALALSPGSAIASRRRDEGEVRVALVEPRSVGGEGGGLSEFDAAWIVAPDQLTAAGWRAVAGVAERGGLILISPPARAQTHAWPDAMNEALGLTWTIARTATDFPERASLTQDRSGWSGPDLLEVVAAELPELVRPVRVAKALAVTGSADAFDTLLSIDVPGATGATMPLLAIARASQPGTPPRASPADGSTSPTSPAAQSRGLVALLTVAPDLSWTDLPAKPLMVPLVQELVRQGVGRAMASRVATAGQSPLLPNGTRELVPARIAALSPPSTPSTPSAPSSQPEGDDPADSAQSVPVSGGLPDQPIRHAGLFLARDGAGVTLAPVSFVADAEASSTSAMQPQDASRWLASTGIEPRWLDDANLAEAASATTAAGAASADSAGSAPLSTLLLMIAGVIAVAELAMARAFSHARREDPA